MTSCLHSCASVHTRKGVYSKRKEFPPNVGYIPFQNGTNLDKVINLNKLTSPESASVPRNRIKLLLSYGRFIAHRINK